MVAAELGLAEATVHRWKAQDLIDRGDSRAPRLASAGDSPRPGDASRSWRPRLGSAKQAAKLFAGGACPKASRKPSARSSLELTGRGFSAKRCCRILGVAASGFFMWRYVAALPPSPRCDPVCLADRPSPCLVRAIHADSRGTYGLRRVNAELICGHGVIVNRKTVRKIMRLQGLRGSQGQASGSGAKANAATAADLVDRHFAPPGTNQLWVTDITQHPTREARSTAGWSWMSSPAGWSADRSTATKPPPWSPTPWAWPSQSATQPPGRP